jgi:hypothetical protein
VSNVKNGDTTLAALLKRQAKISQTEGDDGFASSKRKNGARNAPTTVSVQLKVAGKYYSGRL